MRHVLVALCLLGAVRAPLVRAATDEVPPAPSTAPSTARTPLLVLDLTPEGAVEPSTVRLLGSLVTSELSRYPELLVLSNTDVKQMVNVEAERSMLGCSSESCLAELADALGARLVVYGSVGMLGTRTVLTLNLFDSQTTQSLGREYLEVASVDALSAAVPSRLRGLMTRFYAENGLTLPHLAQAPEEPGEAIPIGVVALVSGGVGVAAGAALTVVGLGPWSNYQDARDELAGLQNSKAPLNTGDLGKFRTTAERAEDRWKSWGLASTVAGGALIVAGAAAAIWGTTEVME